MKLTASSPPTAASFELLGLVGPCVTNRKLFHQHRSPREQHRLWRSDWVSAREPSTGELIFRLLKSPSGRSRNPSRMLVHCRLDRHWLVPIPTPPTRQYHVGVNCSGRRELAENLRRSLPIVSPFEGAAAAAHLQHFRLTHQNQIAYFG